MKVRNKIATIKVPLSLDTTTNRILDDLAGIGIFGKNKAQVAATIVHTWIWENEEKLIRQGVKIAGKSRT